MDFEKMSLREAKKLFFSKTFETVRNFACIISCSAPEIIVFWDKYWECVVDEGKNLFFPAPIICDASSEEIIQDTGLFATAFRGPAVALFCTPVEIDKERNKVYLRLMPPCRASHMAVMCNSADLENKQKGFPTWSFEEFYDPHCYNMKAAPHLEESIGAVGVNVTEIDTMVVYPIGYHQIYLAPEFEPNADSDTNKKIKGDFSSRMDAFCDVYQQKFINKELGLK